jgi:uncharacterized membrane protein YgcG
MANEHTIRVSARGEFGQLENGLKNLQKDLKSVLGEIDKGARRGGLFDDTQLRALDVYRARFKQSMDEINREMNKQNDTIDQLHRRRENSSKDEQKAIDEEIRRREKALDKLRRQITYVEDLARARNKEADAYRRSESAKSSSSDGGGSSSGGGFSSGGGGGGGGIFGSAMAKILGMGKFMVGLAGIGGIATMASQSYNLAYQSQTTPLNLAQRLRGNGYSGSSKGMWDTIGAAGRSDKMGYTSAESWQFMDMYSRKAGSMSPDATKNALKFGRAYGLETGETANSLGTNRALGGASSSQEFANMIAGAVGKSGMTPRILEVMETSNGLLEQMNTSLKDGGTKQILAYQTTLDKIGNEKGMMRLTGQQGANVIAGMGGIFNPGQDNPWKWMGIQALQQYNPKKYGKMGLYDLETNFEDGLENTDNVAAMAKYLKKQSGGDENVMKRMLQKWLQDGGYNATKQQVNDLYKATDGFTAFDSKKMNSVMADMKGGDATAKYQDRMQQYGQQILDTDARFEKTLENLGQPILTVVQGIKEGITSLLEELQKNGIEGILNDIKKFMEDHLTETILAGALAAALAASKLFGGKGGTGGKGGNGGNGSNGPSGKVPTVLAGGAKVLKGAGLVFEGKQLFDVFSPDNVKKHKKLAKEAGYKGDITWMDRLVAENMEALGGDPKKFYEAMSKKGRNKTADKMDTWFDKLFGDSSKQKGALKDAEKSKKGDLAWYQYANPNNWGKINFKNPFSWGDTAPAKELVQKQKQEDAYNSLNKLGDTGLVTLTNLSTEGADALIQMQKQGLIKLDEGKTMATTTLSGFSAEGEAKLKELSANGQISISGFTSDGKAKITALNDEGQKNLVQLQQQGLIHIGAFKQESTLQITSLSKDGAKKLAELQKNGDLSLTSMDKNTKDKLEKVRKNTEDSLNDVKKTHTEFKDKSVGKDGIFQKWADGFGSLWDKFIESIKSILPDWLTGGDKTDTPKAPGDPGYISGGGKAVSSNVLGYKNALTAAGKANGISDVSLLMAMMQQESGGRGSNPMQLNGAKNPTASINGGVAYFAKVLKKSKGDVQLALQAYNMGEGYIDYVNKNYGGKTSVAAATAFSNYQKQKHGYKTYGDPHYVEHVLQYYKNPTVTQPGGNASNNFFDGWQKRITTHYGALDGSHKTPHSGVDIDGTQGDALQAIAKGKILSINMDDGGKYDKDGKKNSNAGGTELAIQMPDGRVYSYSHMSAINQQMLEAFKSGHNVNVNAGDYVGNLGGDPGKAGSGYSTTGSHLHLGLKDRYGVRLNPETWLNSLNSGESSDPGIDPSAILAALSGRWRNRIRLYRQKSTGRSHLEG